MVDRMDPFSEDALINFVNALYCVFRGKHVDSIDIDPQQGRDWRDRHARALIGQSAMVYNMLVNP